MNWLTDAVVAIPVLGVMIFIHEFGHFVAAKCFGVRVLTFSLGFGKRLFGFRRGDTDYRVSLVPLGGYVKMAGDDPTKPRDGRPDDYLAKPRWKRFFIVLMGPAMNVLMAVGLLAGLYRYHFPKLAYKEELARVGEVGPNSPAAEAGILPGDLIVRLGDLRDPTWEDVEIKIYTTVGEALPVEISREGKEFSTAVTPKAEGPSRVSYVGWEPCLPVVIGTVDPQMPAGRANLKPGDRIVAIGDRRISCWQNLAPALQEINGKQVSVSVLRDGKDLQFQLTPVYGDLRGTRKWMIGVGLRDVVVVRQLPWGRAISASLSENLQTSLLTFEVLSKILTRRMPPQALSGPIGIAQMSGEALRAGVAYLLHFVSMISLSLAIFNLLPIPILDGGVILLLVIEGVIRRDLSLEVKERVVQVGFVFLLLLAVFVMYNDIVKSFRAY